MAEIWVGSANHYLDDEVRYDFLACEGTIADLKIRGGLAPTIAVAM